MCFHVACNIAGKFHWLLVAITDDESFSSFLCLQNGSVEVILKQLQENASSQLFVLENFPSTEPEISDFNGQVCDCEWNKNW